MNGWRPRLGNPRTDEERRARHLERFGTAELPPRGTGWKKRKKKKKKS